mmetsp:Transcript_5823/g.12718  ORF Transcript_5823/g.12718 Transcript_5823/m.12718 type:complete len:210 (+) Transcript_5823:678-1307(+)
MRISLDETQSSSLPKFSSSWQIPHDCGQSVSIDAGFFSHSPSTAQDAHDSSLSKHTAEHSSQVLGQSAIIAVGFTRHSSFPQISHCVAFLSAQMFASQTWQLAGHVLRVKPGFLKHCSSAAQPGQSLCVSLHCSVQTPQETGHCLSMKPGFSPHEPAAVQLAHSACTSWQVGVQRPHDVGHALSMKSGFFLQSPALAQLLQEMSVSVHS